MNALTFAQLEKITRCRLGTTDSTCPICSAHRRPANQRKKVLRIWQREQDFATYKCQHCGAQGYAHRDSSRRQPARNFGQHPSPELIAPLDRQRQEQYAGRRLGKAQWFWSRCQPIEGSPAERYLRQVRGYNGPIPATLGFLEPSKPKHHPAMIAAFGIPEEAEPGVLEMRPDQVRGVHLTLLRTDGSGKADVEPNKLMIGSSTGWPIVLAQMNDLLGLIICEGIETGLSLHEATGCGVWAAGAAGRLPALADKVPAYVDCVTVAGEADAAGRKGAIELAQQLEARGLHCELRFLGEDAAAA